MYTRYISHVLFYITKEYDIKFKKGKVYGIL
jgi:hypothetical protein